MVDLYQAVSISEVKAFHVFYALFCVLNMLVRGTYMSNRNDVRGGWLRFVSLYATAV